MATGGKRRYYVTITLHNDRDDVLIETQVALRNMLNWCSTNIPGDKCNGTWAHTYRRSNGQVYLTKLRFDFAKQSDAVLFELTHGR